MTDLYEKAVAPGAGLRLHLNENTSGCSPAVIEALRAITPEMIAFYPDYAAPVAAVARRLGVAESHIALTNGLDEGILAACIAAVVADGSTTARTRVAEAVVVVPAFEMQSACARAAGARVVEVCLDEHFGFPTPQLLDAIRPETRIVFITSPNNPTGMLAPAKAIQTIAQAAPHALVFVDEAYADFSGTTLIGSQILEAHANIVIGRTFSKAYGLAGLRCGAVIAAPDLIGRIRGVLPPYSINAAAVVALGAALDDRAHYEHYLEEVRRSKAMVYEAFGRLGIEYWPSAANFVLARFGDEAPRLCRLLADRGIFVRDRSRHPLCGGCVRITVGVVAHTARCLDAIEEVLCGAR
jgi:histidinol-phosphate aminotransferase